MSRSSRLIPRLMSPAGLLVLVGVLAAPAAAQTPAYEVTASTSPAAAEASSVALRFRATSQAVTRPASAKELRFTFAGIRLKPHATGRGGGYIKFLMGATADPNDVSIACNLRFKLKIDGRDAAMELTGGPGTTVAGGSCPVSYSGWIGARLTNTSAGLRLSVPFSNAYRHPIDELSQGMLEIKGTIRKRTRSRHGKRKAGPLQATGGCLAGTRAISLVVTGEDGATTTSNGAAAC